MSSKENLILTASQEEELKLIGDLYRSAIYSKDNLPSILEQFISDLKKQKGEICQTIISEVIRYKYVIQDVKLFATLRKWIDELYKILNNNLPDNVFFTIECRTKSLQSTMRKILKNYLEGTSIDLFDLVAFRIILDSPDSEDIQEKHCYEVKDLCTSFFKAKFCTLCKPIKLIGNDELVKDYILVPKENGYKSIHLAFKTVNNDIFEAQIRTLDMHERSEFGIAEHSGYKDKEYSVVSIFIYFDVEKVHISMFRKLCNGDLYDKVGLCNALHIETRSKTFN